MSRFAARICSLPPPEAICLEIALFLGSTASIRTDSELLSSSYPISNDRKLGCSLDLMSHPAGHFRHHFSGLGKHQVAMPVLTDHASQREFRLFQLFKMKFKD